MRDTGRSPHVEHKSSSVGLPSESRARTGSPARARAARSAAAAATACVAVWPVLRGLRRLRGGSAPRSRCACRSSFAAHLSQRRRSEGMRTPQPQDFAGTCIMTLASSRDKKLSRSAGRWAPRGKASQRSRRSGGNRRSPGATERSGLRVVPALVGRGNRAIGFSRPFWQSGGRQGWAKFGA